MPNCFYMNGNKKILWINGRIVLPKIAVHCFQELNKILCGLPNLKTNTHCFWSAPMIGQVLLPLKFCPLLSRNHPLLRKSLPLICFSNEPLTTLYRPFILTGIQGFKVSGSQSFPCCTRLSQYYCSNREETSQSEPRNSR